MSHSKLSLSAVAEAGEPKASRSPVPVALFVLLFALLFLGMYYFDRHGGWFEPAVYTPYVSLKDLQMYQPATGGANLERGRAVYENVCALCHNVDGSGKPNQAPPLSGSEWVVGAPSRVIRIPLAGLSGPIEVKGQQWNLAMPAMGAALSDDDLAAVLTYMRSSWGNKGSEITPDMVKAIRGALGSRSQPFTVSELLTVPEK